MSLYKRKGSPYWWVKLAHKGHRLQESTGTANKRQAQEFHDRRKSELWEQERLGVKPRHKWEEAVLRYLDEGSHKVRLDDDRNHLRKLQPYLEGMDLASINRTLVDNLIHKFAKEGSSNTTVNRRMGVLGAILRKAVNEWEWLERMPHVRKLKEPKGRVRFLSRPQAQSLLRELPPHLRVMAAFSLATGLRQSNVKNLRWEQVDLERGFAWIQAHEAKARRGIPVPLSPDAVMVLRHQQGQHSEYVFTYRGHPIRQIGTKAWRAALVRAGIPDFRWHDLRHTWASWHVQSGTPLYALQEMGGWASSQMVQRYAHLSAEDLSRYASRFSLAESGTTLNSGYILATQKTMH